MAADYGTQSFTPTSNKLTKSYSENCKPKTPNYKLNVSTSYTICPNTSLTIEFTIVDDDKNYYDINNIAGSYVDLPTGGWGWDDTATYSNGVNKWKVKSSKTAGEDGEAEICVNGKSTYITINNENAYVCGGIEKV